MFFRTTNITPHGNASRVEDLHAGLCSLSHVGHVLKSMIKKCLTQSAETMHNWARYLIFFQYTGTKYSGVVKVPPHQLNKKGVQDHLEDAIRRLKPINPVHLSVSSRTDTGVHALSNSAHFDLHRKNDRPPFTEDVLVLALNNHLREEQIRVTRAHRVPDDFHARYRAQSRTYVYRVALGFSHHTLLPLTESELCWHIPDTEISFLELTFRSRSFLYRQVRRMTGALVAVGQGRISVPQLQEILEARDSLAYPYHMLAPARGLFLTRVEYRETDLQLSQQTSEE
ncbi:tRNA pseudouridine synthase-like 1 isoform X2 [Centropristis striata]|uniref:tRNA pseudouridine synthase-like 1 isoform X2 n=1 Tax=Centropristis striata TaxID=184440 RepID=UPI0027E1291D|nr:tRNA pseudouridine synthase-like 1 isoform X2 [Centropristis striata]